MRVCPSCETATDESGRFCPACGVAMADSAEVTATTSSAAVSLIGTTLDGFRIEAILGGGAFGTVYRGRQLGLDRPVALKVPTHEIAADPVMAKRFAREARSAARVTHPGVVAIYAVGELPDRRPYLAMQLIDGEPLDRILAAGPIPAARALGLGRLIASALSETHAADVVHRDLKPTNIVWRVDRNGDDRVTLVDFGIAVCRPGNADATRLTSGGLIGTPHYMSPEQAHGEQVDARADLYALGCILFELVTGAPPFEGSGFEVLLAHLGRPIPHASDKNPEVPEVVDALICDLMAKKPDDRPQSADVVVTMIDDALAQLGGAPRTAEGAARVPRAKRKTQQPTVRERPLPRQARGRWLALGALGVLALSAAGFAAIKLTRHSAATTAPTTGSAGGDDDDKAPSVFTGRRQVVLDEGEMTARVTLYDPLVAGTRARTMFDLVTPVGPFVVSQVVVTIEEPTGGEATGVTATASKKTPGRYAFFHVFPKPGRYVVRVFPPEAYTVFKIDVDVTAP